jgi:hypothetical protein
MRTDPAAVFNQPGALGNINFYTADAGLRDAVAAYGADGANDLLAQLHGGFDRTHAPGDAAGDPSHSQTRGIRRQARRRTAYAQRRR